MWSSISSDDTAKLEQWLKIVREINPCYATLSTADLQSSIATKQGRIWLCTGQGYEIAARIEFDSSYGRFRLVNMAILGRVTPKVVITECLPQLHQFLSQQHIRSLIAWRPQKIANRRMNDFYRLAALDPRLAMTVLEETEHACLWEIACIHSAGIAGDQASFN